MKVRDEAARRIEALVKAPFLHLPGRFEVWVVIIVLKRRHWYSIDWLTGQGKETQSGVCLAVFATSGLASVLSLKLHESPPRILSPAPS